MARRKKGEIIPEGKLIETKPVDNSLIRKDDCALCQLSEEGRKKVKKELDSGVLTVIDVAAHHGMTVGRVMEHIYYHHVESAYLMPDDGIDYYINSLNGMLHKLQVWFLHIADTEYPDATTVTQVTTLAKEIRSCLQLMSTLEGKLGGTKSVEDFAELQSKYSKTLRDIVDMVCDDCQGKILDYLAVEQHN